MWEVDTSDRRCRSTQACALDTPPVAVPATAITVGTTGTATIVEASRPTLHGHRLILRPSPGSGPETLTVLLTLTNDEPPAPGDRVHIHINPDYCQPLTPPFTSAHHQYSQLRHELEPTHQTEGT